MLRAPTAKNTEYEVFNIRVVRKDAVFPDAPEPKGVGHISLAGTEIAITYYSCAAGFGARHY